MAGQFNSDDRDLPLEASGLPLEASGLPLDAAVDFVRGQAEKGAIFDPRVALILGSGLGGLADKIVDPVGIPFGRIPGFGTSSASGHRGQLILGTIESTQIIAMAGRFHRYEGWSNEQVAFPVRLMARLGAKSLIVSNAAGGANPKLVVGDIVVIRDHINLIGGPTTLERHSRSASLTRRGELYDPELSSVAMKIAVANQFNAYEGTYLATLGPNYETRSEYRMMRRIGADVVGMSTVPEVLAAAGVNLRVLGLSMVSNVASPDRPVKADHNEVLEAGRHAEVKMEAIVRGVIRSL